MRAPESFRADEKSTCGAATGTFTVDIGEGWSKADGERTEAERVMLRLRHAQADATTEVTKALEQHDRGEITIEQLGAIFEERKHFVPTESDLYRRCHALVPKLSAAAATEAQPKDEAKAEVSGIVACLDCERKRRCWGNVNACTHTHKYTYTHAHIHTYTHIHT